MSFWKKLAKYKKASMELSINAIVILIIAMVVLGLGIVFIRGMFGSASEKLSSAVGGVEVGNPASADKPLTIDKEIVISKSSPSKVIEVSIYNPDISQHTNVKPYLDPTKCAGDKNPNGFATGSILLVAPGQTISPGKSIGYNAILQLDNTKDPTILSQTTIICTITATSDSGPIADVSATTSILIS